MNRQTSQTYTFNFEDVHQTLRHGKVSFVDGAHQVEHTVNIAAPDIRFLDRLRSEMSPVLADLVDLAVSVYAADRLCHRRTDERATIQIRLPVRAPNVLSNPTVVKHLVDVLHWFTYDNWSFDFELRATIPRPAELQPLLDCLDQSRPVEVSLWSGGLDSFAGLCHRISADRDDDMQHVLLGAGASTQMESTQKRLIDCVDPARSHTKLVQAPIRMVDADRRRRNSTPRARGFVFLLLGAVCSLLHDQDRLFVFENGVGAINLRYPGSDSATDHSRSVHPISLKRMGVLVSAAIGQEFCFENPFLFSTKAQLCSTLLDSRHRGCVPLTVSCDRRHHAAEQQCGYCSSCLLRRQALAAVGLEDRTCYVLNSRRRKHRESDGDHLRAVLCQVHMLRQLLCGKDPWLGLVGYDPGLIEVAKIEASRLGASVASTSENLVSLYRAYVEEWGRVSEIISLGLIDDHDYRVRA